MAYHSMTITLTMSFNVSEENEWVSQYKKI